jgi:hypothetical protein
LLLKEGTDKLNSLKARWAVLTWHRRARKTIKAKLGKKSVITANYRKITMGSYAALKQNWVLKKRILKKL